MTNKEADFATLMLLSMPPMEQREREAMISKIQKLDADWDPESSSFRKQLAKFQCTDQSISSSAPLAKQLLIKLNDYQTKLYGDKRSVTARHCCVDDEDASTTTLTVTTYVEHVDSANCASGLWAATWKIRLENEQQAELSGTIHVHAYHGEGEANVQTKSSRNYPTTVVSVANEMVHSIVAKFEHETMSYDEQLSKAIVDQIAKYETAYYEALNDSNQNVDLRKIRRILPITKTRFKWDSAAQKNVKLLNERSTAS